MAPRRSSRLTGESNQKLVHEQLDDGDEDLGETEVVHKPRKKRPRTKAQDDDLDVPASARSRTKPRQKTRGKLSRLTEMPLEILHEILSLVRPYDLLRLSRTTKTLRSLLMSRSARQTWVEALLTVPGLPPCPEDLTEPAYVRLAFEQTCHLCGTLGVSNAMWKLRVRACSKCLESNTAIFGKRESPEVKELTYPFDGKAIALVPWDHGSGQTRHDEYCLLNALKDVCNKMAFFPVGSAGLQEYAASRRTLVERIREHALECLAWHEAHRDDRREDLEQARKRRRIAIEQRVEELGYGKEIRWLHSHSYSMVRERLEHNFMAMKQIKQPKDLTDRTWNNMKAEVVEFFQKMRSTRIRHERFELLRSRIDTLAKVLPREPVQGLQIALRVVDLHLSEPFRAVLERGLDEGDEPPSEDTVTQEDFEDLIAALPEHAAPLQAAREAQLLDLMPGIPGGSPDAESDVARLKLATSCFSCSSCHTGRKTPILGYEEAMRHQCTTKRSAWYDRDEGPDSNTTDPRKLFLVACDTVDGCGGAGEFVWHSQASEAAERVVRLLGKDPTTTTRAQLEELDARLWCSCYSCYDGGMYGTGAAKKRIFTWRHAVAHMSKAPLERLSAAEEARAKAVPPVEVAPHGDFDESDDEFDEDYSHTRRLQPILVCARCHYKARTGFGMGIRDHLARKHNVVVPQVGTDYTVGPDSFITAAPVWLSCAAVPRKNLFYDDGLLAPWVYAGFFDSDNEFDDDF